MSFAVAVQTAIYDRLRGYAPLVAVLASAPAPLTGPAVYDSVPQAGDAGDASAFPYVTIGEDTLVGWDTASELGAELTLTIHTWSRARGRQETKQIQGHIYDALHRYDLAVTGYHLVGIDWEGAESFMDPDGLTRHGVQTFRIIIETP